MSNEAVMQALASLLNAVDSRDVPRMAAVLVGALPHCHCGRLAVVYCTEWDGSYAEFLREYPPKSRFQRGEWDGFATCEEHKFQAFVRVEWADAAERLRSLVEGR